LKSLIRDTLTILITAAVLFVGMQFTIQRYSVDGPSMMNDFLNGQQVFVNKLVYYFHEPQRGDVIIFDSPTGGTEGYIKRIIGLPGETVDIKDGVVYIHEPDGTVFPLTEPYVADPARMDYTGKVIPPGQYFVMGDNRNNSSDSRAGWTVPRNTIIGKVWLSVWPISTFGLIPSYAYAGN
jgi:signal peptidase I